MTATATTGRLGALLRQAVVRLRAAGLATAQLDAELLFARALGTSRLALHLEPGRALSAPAEARVEALVARRERQEPLQYILGETDFCGLSLRVGPGVFIPRPETELLVERAVAACPAGPGIVLDLCTGSGAVACAVAARRPAAAVWAVERSAPALAWARENVGRLGLDTRVTVLAGDLLSPLTGPGAPLAGRCDVVVANPPYLGRTTLAALPEEVRGWEPEEALDGGVDGLAVIARILAGAPAALRPGGALVLEIGHGQAAALRRAVAADGRYGPLVAHTDFRGVARVVEARRV